MNHILGITLSIAPSPRILAAFSCALAAFVLGLPVQAQTTRTWVGADGDMSAAGNWNPAGVPSTSAGDLLLFNGQFGAATSLTFPGATFSGSDGLGDITIASAQTAALAIANSGAANSVFRLRPNADFSIEAGAGAFSMGTSGNAFYLNLANHANGNQFINNSANLATFGTQTVINASGGTGGYAIFGGSGDWLVSGYLTNAVTRGLQKEGAGTLTLTGNNAYTGPTTINGGRLVVSGTGTKMTSTSASIASGATLEINATSAILDWAANVTFSGAGTILKTGAGTFRIPGQGGTFHLAAGSLIDVQAGTFDAGSSANEVWAANLSSLNVAAGATISELAYRPAQFDALTGAGTIQLHAGAGPGPHTFTIGANNTAAGAYNSAGSATFSGNIEQGNGTAELIKIGNGTQILSGVNTYTGPTTIDGGVLNLHMPGSSNYTYTGGTISINNGSTLRISRSGSANQYWFNAKTFLFGNTGGGTIDTTSGMNVVVYGGSVFRTSGGATNMIGGASGINLHAGNTVTWDVVRGSDPASDLTVSAPFWNSGGVTKTGDGIVTLTAAQTYTGATTILGGTLKLAGGQNRLMSSPISVGSGALLTCQDYAQTLSAVLTLNGGTVSGTGEAGWGSWILRNRVDVTADSTLSAVRMTAANSGSGGFNISSGATLNITGSIEDTNEVSTVVKGGAGTMIFVGANTYTGTTTIRGGTLALDYSVQNGSKLSDTTALVLGGGTLDLASGSHTEVVGSTTLLTGTDSMVTRTSGASVLQMGAITRNADAYIDFSADGIATTSTPNDASGMLGTWATVGRADWAVNSTGGANGLVTAYNAYADVTRLSSGPKAIADAPASHVRIIEGTGTAAPITLAAPTTTINTLNQSASGGGSASIIDPAGQTLSVQVILAGSGAGPLTIGTGTNNGTLRTATSGGDLFLSNQSANALTIRSAVADNAGASSLTKTGSGTVVLAGVNTYTGETTIRDGGTLRVGGAGQLGSGSHAGTITLRDPASQFDYASSANQTLSGTIRGSGAVAMSGSGTLTVAGAANSYSGATTISGGTLKLGVPTVTAPSALAGLVVHLDASQIAQAHGTDVSAWTNLAAGGAGDFTATTGTQPTLISEGNLLSGLPVVKFNASATLRNLTNFGNDATVMFVGRMDGGTNARLVGGTNNWLLGYHGGGQDKAHFNAWLYNPANVMDYTGRIYESVQSGSTASFYNNGVLLAQGTNASFQGPNGLVLGGYSTTSETSLGSIGEVLVFNRALTDAERVQMEQYLRAKWYGPLPATTAVSITGGGVLDMDGVNQTIGSLAGDSTAQVLLDGGWLTVGNANTSTTYSGVIADGSAPGGGMTKTGTGTLVLAGNQSNTYSGPTVLQAGWLQLAKTGGAYAVPGDFLGVNNPSPVVYTTQDNQFAPGSVMYFQNFQGDHVRFELMGTTQTLAGIDNTGAGNRGVIQHRERVDAGLAVGTQSTLILNGSDDYYYAGYLRGQGGTLSLVKEGLGTQTLSGANITYNGGTTLNDGVLNYVGSNNTIGGAMVLNGGILEHSGNTGYLVQSGVATVSADATISMTGTGTTSYQSQMYFDSGLGIAGGTTLTLNTSLNNGIVLRGSSVLAGSLVVNGAGTGSLAGRANVQFGTNGASNFANTDVTLNNATMNVGQGTNNDANTVGAAVKSLNGNGRVVSDAVARTLTVGANDGDGSFSGVLADGTSILSLAKTGNGTQTLSGANTYTGTTTVAQGALKLDLGINSGGVLAPATVPTMGGGTLLVQGSGSGVSSQTLGNLVLAANTASTIAVDPNGGTGTTLTLGSTWTRNAGAAVHFDLSAGTPATAVVASSPALNSGIIGGWATIKDNTATGFATVAGGNIVRYTAGTELRKNSNDAAVNFTSTPTDTDHVAGTLTMDPGAHAVNTVAFNSGSGGTLNLNGTTLAVSGGLLFDGAGDYRVESGTIGGAGAALYKSGSGTLTLANGNTYTGATTIAGGTLKLENAVGTLPVSSGLVAHWDAAAITGVADGAQLNTWTDSSASARNATRQGGTPVYVENGGSGLPVVRFETSGDSWFNFSAINDIRTVFFVGKELQPGNALNYFLGDSGVYHFHRGDGDIIWSSGNASANVRNGQTYVNGYQVTGTTTTFGDQSVKLLSLVTTGNVQANQLSRDRNIAGRSWRGDIGEILIFNQALSDADRLAVEQYLMGKWFGTLAPTTAVALTDASATLDLNGFRQTIGSLSGVAGSQVLLGGGTLTVGNNNATTVFAGVIADGGAGGGGLTKDGTGDLVLAGDASNTFTGPTLVQSGRLGLSKTGGAYAIPGDIIGIHNASPDIYATVDNQFAPGAVMYFEGNSGDHVRFELLGTTQTLAGIDNAAGRRGYGVIQHREQVTAGSVGALSTLVLNGSGNYFFDGYLRDTGGKVALVKEGSGTQTLSGSNINYTGTTTVNGGVLNVVGGAYTGSAGAIVGPDGTLIVDTSDNNRLRGPLSVAGTIQVKNTAAHTIGGDIALYNGTLDSGSDVGTGSLNNRYGTFFIGANRIITANGASSVIQGTNNTIGINNGVTLTLNTPDPGDALTISGRIVAENNAGTGALAKIGLGSVTLSGANTYLGTTTVNAGMLLVNNAAGSGTGSGAVQVNAGTLGGTGTISGTVTVGDNLNAIDSYLAPGMSPGILSTGSLTMNSDAALLAELWGPTAGDPLNGYDQVNVSGSVLLNSPELLLDLQFAPAVGSQFVLINNDGSDAIGGTFDGLDEGAFLHSVFDGNAYAFLASYRGGTGNDFVLTAVPEPSSLLLGLLALGGLLWLCRRHVRRRSG